LDCGGVYLERNSLPLQVYEKVMGKEDGTALAASFGSTTCWEIKSISLKCKRVRR
jgi:hypothetical protein